MAAGRSLSMPASPLPQLALLLLLLLLELTSSALSANLSADSEYSVCNTRCCRVEPNCSAALHVTCRCYHEKRLILRRGDFPKSVETINILGVRWFRIEEHALTELTALRRLEVRRIDNLRVYTNGLALPINSSLGFIVINGVDVMKIDSHAFSGYWDNGVQIKIGYVKRLSIDKNAFKFRSQPEAPSLVIEQSSLPYIDAIAFNASFSYLTLDTIAAKQCRRNAFDGEIGVLNMERVNISEVREGCITGSGTLHRLSVVASRLGVVRHRGICGNIPSVSIMDSRISILQPNGIQLRTNSLDIRRSHFNSIMTRGLNVKADEVSLGKVIVNVLHGHALKAVQVATQGSQGHSSLRIYEMTVKEAYRDSLAFDAATDVQMERLSVEVPNPPVCPVTRWVRQLTGASQTATFTDRERHILDMLQRSWLCPDQPVSSAMPGTESGTAPTKEQGDPGRGTLPISNTLRSSSEDGGELKTEETGDDGWSDIKEVSIVCGVLAVLVIVLSVLLVRERRARTPRSPNKSKQEETTSFISGGSQYSMPACDSRNRVKSNTQTSKGLRRRR